MLTTAEQETLSAVKNAAREYVKKAQNIDWEQRRYELAKDYMFAQAVQGYMLVNEMPQQALDYADSLINALRKTID